MTRMNRRGFVGLVAGTCGALVTVGWSDAEGGQRRPVVRRRARRRVRRRVRRRAVRRMVRGRPVWVVPVALAVGWELAYENRIVVVKEIKVVEREGAKVQVAVVQSADGKLEDVEILREDTDDNRKDLEGTVLADTDKTTPGIETEVDDDK